MIGWGPIRAEEGRTATRNTNGKSLGKKSVNQGHGEKEG